MMHRVKFVSGLTTVEPDYQAVWFHAGRFHIAAREEIVTLLAAISNPLTVHLSDKWQWDLDADSAQSIFHDIAGNGNVIISWKYIND